MAVVAAEGGAFEPQWLIGPLTGVTGRVSHWPTPSRLRRVHNYVSWKMASLSEIYEHRQRSEMEPSNAPVVV
jgi:hypothetical protein